MKKILPFLILLPTLSLARQPDSTYASILGYWEGAYLREGLVQLLKMNVETREGQLQVFISVPEGGILEASPRDLRYDSNQLSFVFIHGQTTLLVDAAAGEMRGTAIGRDSTKTRVHLKRMLKPVEPKIVREKVRFQSGAVTMAGTLFLPATRGPHPAIIIVSGRGYGSRAGNAADATRLAQRGVASLIFDGRGVGESGGDRMKTTAEERYQDVIAAIDLLAARKDIDAKQIGLWGVSAGGWVIPIAAQRSGKVAFLMLDVGPAESLAEQQGHVVAYNMRWFAKEKFTEEEFKAAYAYQKKWWNCHGRKCRGKPLRHWSRMRAGKDGRRMSICRRILITASWITFAAIRISTTRRRCGRRRFRCWHGTASAITSCRRRRMFPNSNVCSKRRAIKISKFSCCPKPIMA